MTTRGVLTRPDSMASFRLKSLTIHPNRVSSVLLLPVGAKGVAERSKHVRMPRAAWIRSSPPIHWVSSLSSFLRSLTMVLGATLQAW